LFQQKQRYFFIDLVRFVAVLFMIQGHVFDALLSPQVKALPWYYILDFFHGFVAPAFFFSSGIAYGLSTTRQWDDQISWEGSARRRMSRFLQLIAVGYALHLPYFSLRKTLSDALPSEVDALLQSDALQCIGVTLLLLQIAVFLVKRKNAFIRGVAAVAAAIVFVSPLLWSVNFSERLPLWLATYFNSQNSSWFPLFPWSAYILCGVLLGFAFANSRDHRHAASLMRKNIVLGLGLIAMAWLATQFPFDIYPAHDFWKTNPIMFFMRVSVVSIFTSLVFLAEQSLPSIPRIPLILGKESLFIYILHLVIVYGSVFNRGLAQWIGPTLSLLQAIGMFVLVFAFIALFTLLWHQWNSKNHTTAAYMRTAAAAIVVVEFIIRPW
jgi:uncharacterized membrane protein